MLAYTFCLLGLVILDQLTKIWAVNVLSPIGNIPLLGEWLSFTYVENRGMAFSLLDGNVLLLVCLTSVILLLVFVVLLKDWLHSKIANWLLLLVVSGGVGNLIDRAMRGYVVDFINFHPFNYPVFNVADIFICVGAVALMVYLIFFDKEFLKSKEKSKD